MNRNYFLDTEFMSNTGELISIAIVNGDRRLHLVSNEFNPKNADNFVKQHVLPQLPANGTWISRKQISKEIEKFLKPDWHNDMEFWCWYGAWDWVMLTGLWGGFDKNPWWLPMKYKEYSDMVDNYGWKEWRPHKFEPDDYDGGAHDALYDALCLQKAFIALQRKLGK